MTTFVRSFRHLRISFFHCNQILTESYILLCSIPGTSISITYGFNRSHWSYGNVHSMFQSIRIKLPTLTSISIQSQSHFELPIALIDGGSWCVNSVATEQSIKCISLHFPVTIWQLTEIRYMHFVPCLRRTIECISMSSWMNQNANCHLDLEIRWTHIPTRFVSTAIYCD